jgi:hypothetical protein
MVISPHARRCQYGAGCGESVINKAKQMEENSNNIKYLTGNLIGILAGIAIGFLMFK